MLFNSYLFIFVFLPVTLLGYYALRMANLKAAWSWLVAASLFYYAYWNPSYLLLILSSIVINYGIGYFLANRLSSDTRRKRALFIAGVIFNLSLLGYYKYGGLLVETVNALSSSSFSFGSMMLPLAISFFTFQQISFLADSYAGVTRQYRFLDYILLVTYFPHLIAGPIVHYRELMSEFRQQETGKGIHSIDIAVGLMVFSIGLFKKVMLADEFGALVTPAFNAAASGESVGFFPAWIGVLSYALQLYFDFSGYSDMAIGLSRMFGVRLPLNFYSPYKAHNIIDFWRRWHITLSRFLRDYLYIPLGGNRKGKWRRYLNLMITMFLGGLWHGAGWQFAIWGLLHGFYLSVNHFWHYVKRRIWPAGNIPIIPGARLVSTGITFLAVTVAWAFFRAADIGSALRLLHGMSGANKYEFPYIWRSALAGLGLAADYRRHASYNGITEIMFVMAGLVIVWALPNTYQVMARFKPAYDSFEDASHPILNISWRPNLSWAAVCVVSLLVSLAFMDRVSEFLYYQF